MTATQPAWSAYGSSPAPSRYRARRPPSNVVGLSISYDRENLLARGLGLEHLREMLVRIARELIRQRVHLAFAGHWRQTEDNFTYDLLRLISAEQEDNSMAGPDTSLPIGRLYNHAAWPDFMEITPAIEAQWINSCRVVRVTQALACIDDAHQVPDDQAITESHEQAVLNRAICLSAMRRLVMSGIHLSSPDVPSPEWIPGITARIALGGRLRGYLGFLPGIFEEALVTLEASQGVPLYLLGGFGGAAGTLAAEIMAPPGTRSDAFLSAWHERETAEVVRLNELAETLGIPADIRGTTAALDALHARLDAARTNPGAALNTGLSDDDSRLLMTTRDMHRAARLIREGLQARLGLTPLPG